MDNIFGEKVCFALPYLYDNLEDDNREPQYYDYQREPALFSSDQENEFEGATDNDAFQTSPLITSNIDKESTSQQSTNIGNEPTSQFPSLTGAIPAIIFDLSADIDLPTSSSIDLRQSTSTDVVSTVNTNFPTLICNSNQRVILERNEMNAINRRHFFIEVPATMSNDLPALTYKDVAQQSRNPNSHLNSGLPASSRQNSFQRAVNEGGSSSTNDNVSLLHKELSIMTGNNLTVGHKNQHLLSTSTPGTARPACNRPSNRNDSIVLQNGNSNNNDRLFSSSTQVTPNEIRRTNHYGSIPQQNRNLYPDGSDEIHEERSSRETISRFRVPLSSLPQSSNGFKPRIDKEASNAASVIATALTQRADASAQKNENEFILKKEELNLAKEKMEFEKQMRIEEMEMRAAELASNEKIQILTLEKEERLAELKMRLELEHRH